MKKLSFTFLVTGVLFFASCDTVATSKEAEEDSVNLVDETIADSSKEIDTALSSIGDSLKADIDSATHKIKERTKALGDVAKQKANEGVEKLKEGAQKIKDAAKAGVDAAQDELKK
ncbi:hypothetical protein [Niabella hibiscisoli]|uniref:hypothetical protein n=1 Tax=Niabella hibiscisoli TaxID=1825928 RepID=UPI001F0D9CDE|nr:hypothetical protein [Niabella hibiscisoli]MCH5720486.1 hypothetical protein [Niabella hibiscisoli]